MAMAQVESANIVGFQDIGTRTGADFELLGSTFIPVGSANLGATVTLFDAVKPAGTFTLGEDSIIVFENGMKQFEVTYIDAATATEVEIAEGWWDTSCIESEAFPAEKCRNAYQIPTGVSFAFSKGLSGSRVSIPNPLPAE